MSEKDEAMKNFKQVINNSNNQKEEQKKADETEENKRKEQEEKQREFEEKRQQNLDTTQPTQEKEEENEPTEEEKEQEEMYDSVRYDISGDKEDEDEEDSDDSPGINVKKSDKNEEEDEEEDKDKDENEDGNKDNNQDETDNDSNSGDSEPGNDGQDEIDLDQKENKHNKMDDDSVSAEKKGAGKEPSSNTQPEANTQTPEKYRSNNSTSSSGVGAGANAAESAEAAEAGAGAEAAATAGAEAGATAEEGGKLAALGGKLSEFLSGIALWKIIIIAVLVVLALIIIVGYVTFFITMPGLVRDKILNFANGIWVNVKGFFVGQETAQVTNEQITEVATYLENMGYDLANYGFLDTKGKAVEVTKNDDGTKTIKSSDGKVIYSTEKDENTGEIKIKTIKSKYIMSYLAAENNTYMVSGQNFNMASFFSNLFDGTENWGSGMINFENISGVNANKYVKIDRENKKMNITYKKHVYQYDMDGWTGRYGKSIEFLLTMHLATMAPDFVYDIVKDDDFNTKVSIALYPIKADIRLKMPNPDNEEELIEITESNYASLGLTTDQWNEVKKYNQNDVETFTPIITNVKHHWYKDLDFSECYVPANNEATDEDDEAFTSTYQYVGLGEEGDVLAGIDNLYVEEVRQNDMFQVHEPKVKKNTKIKEMLLGQVSGTGSNKDADINVNEEYKYYIYDGTSIPDSGLKKDYIIKKIDLESTSEGSTSVKNTRTFTYAFAILESVHSEDAEYILRDLKELFQDIGLNIEEEKGGSGGTVTPLTWPIDKYKPIVWDPQYDAQVSKVIIRHETSTTLGFAEDLDVIMPANGEIIEITREKDKDTGKLTGNDSVKIKLNGTDNQEYEDMYVYISGFKANESLAEKNTYSNKTPIGKTISSDIIIVMTDKKKEAIYNVDEYIVPEAWTALEEVNQISDSNFAGDALNEGVGDLSPYTGSFSEEFYWYLAVALEGMPTTKDSEFTKANRGVEWLSGESYITVGPGIYMHDENCQRFRNNGYTSFNQYDINSVFPKNVTDQVFKQSIDEIYKPVIDNYMAGCTLTQKQFEALVLTAYQRGTSTSTSTLYNVLDAIKDGKTGTELKNIWVYTTSGLEGVSKRRYAEWYLFTYGIYLPPYGDQRGTISFTTDTPYTDALNGVHSVPGY